MVIQKCEKLCSLPEISCRIHRRRLDLLGFAFDFPASLLRLWLKHHFDAT